MKRIRERTPEGFLLNIWFPFPFDSNQSTLYISIYYWNAERGLKASKTAVREHDPVPTLQFLIISISILDAWSGLWSHDTYGYSLHSWLQDMLYSAKHICVKITPIPMDYEIHFWKTNTYACISDSCWCISLVKLSVFSRCIYTRNVKVK